MLLVSRVPTLWGGEGQEGKVKADAVLQNWLHLCGEEMSLATVF